MKNDHVVKNSLVFNFLLENEVSNFRLGQFAKVGPHHYEFPPNLASELKKNYSFWIKMASFEVGMTRLFSVISVRPSVR